MKKNLIEIPYPEEAEITREIDLILARGLEPKGSFYRQITTMYRQLGFKYLFKDLTEIIYLVAIALAFLLMTLPTVLVRIGPSNIYPLIYTLSPLIYLVGVLSFFYRMKRKPTFEIEMTCQYNLYQLAAFRMLVFSGVSILFNGILLCRMTWQIPLNFPLALGISIGALFLFSGALLYGLFNHGGKYMVPLIVLGWFGGNGLLSHWGGSHFSLYLTKVPIILYWGIGAFMICLYLKSLKGLMNLRRIGGNDYVNR